MTFSSVQELVTAVTPVAAIDGNAISVNGEPSPELVDRLAHTAAFGESPEVKGTARWVIRALAAQFDRPRGTDLEWRTARTLEDQFPGLPGGHGVFHRGLDDDPPGDHPRFAFGGQRPARRLRPVV